MEKMFRMIKPNSTEPDGVRRVPTRTGKPGKMEREKSWNFVQTGKVRENHAKNSKTQEISDKVYLLFLVIFK